MTNENQINSWTPLTANVDPENPVHWGFYEAMFGESVEPGFDETIRPATFPGIFGHNNSVDLLWTTYRSETGELLAVHASFSLDESDPDFSDTKERPFLLMVNPSHQRKGIGSIIGKFIYDRYVDKHGQPPNADALSRYENAKITPAGASWLNAFWTK